MPYKQKSILTNWSVNFFSDLAVVNSRDGMTQRDAALACAKDLMTLPLLKDSSLVSYFRSWLVEFAAFNPTGGPVMCLQ